jgi:hypothetical protein
MWVVAVTMGLGVGMAQTAPAQPVDSTAPSRGAQLYDGRLVLTGQLRGHEQALPAGALRCTNCHEPSRQPARDENADASASATSRTGGPNSSFAPRLDQASLAVPQARRGGPPTRYDQAAFCRVLRTSIDPAEVLLNKPMPRYTLGDDDCAALWQFLSQRPALPVLSP